MLKTSVNFYKYPRYLLLLCLKVRKPMSKNKKLLHKNSKEKFMIDSFLHFFFNKNRS